MPLGSGEPGLPVTFRLLILSNVAPGRASRFGRSRSRAGGGTGASDQRRGRSPYERTGAKMASEAPPPGCHSYRRVFALTRCSRCWRDSLGCLPGEVTMERVLQERQPTAGQPPRPIEPFPSPAPEPEPIPPGAPQKRHTPRPPQSTAAAEFPGIWKGMAETEGFEPSIRV